MKMTTYEFAMLITQALAAVGTIGAVITALYLARKSTNICASAKIQLSQIYGAIDERENTENITVSIVNLGTKPFKIDAIGAYDRVNKHYLMFMPDYSNSFCTKAGHQFLESDSGTYIFQKQIFLDNLAIAIDAKKYQSDILSRLRKLNFVAQTNIGQIIEIKIDKSFLDICVKNMN